MQGCLPVVARQIRRYTKLSAWVYWAVLALGKGGSSVRWTCLGVDGSFNAHYGAVLALARAAQDALGADAGQPAGTRDMAGVLLAGEHAGKGDSVQDHLVFWFMSHSDGLVSTRLTGGRPRGRFGLLLAASHCQLDGARAAHWSLGGLVSGVVLVAHYLCCCPGSLYPCGLICVNTELAKERDRTCR